MRHSTDEIGEGQGVGVARLKGEQVELQGRTGLRTGGWGLDGGPGRTTGGADKHVS